MARLRERPRVLEGEAMRRQGLVVVFLLILTVLTLVATWLLGRAESPSPVEQGWTAGARVVGYDPATDGAGGIDPVAVCVHIAAGEYDSYTDETYGLTYDQARVACLAEVAR